jgi:hypothetical protein
LTILACCPRTQWTRRLGVPQFPAVSHHALLATFSDYFNDPADHCLDTRSHGPAPRACREPRNRCDHECAGNGDACNHRQCNPYALCLVVKQNNRSDHECGQATDTKRAKGRHEEFQHDQARSQCNQSHAGKVHRQQLQSIEGQNQRQRTHDTR